MLCSVYILMCVCVCRNTRYNPGARFRVQSGIVELFRCFHWSFFFFFPSRSPSGVHAVIPVEMHPPGGIGRSLSRLPFMSLGPAQKTSDTVAFVFFSHVISHLFSQLHWNALPRKSLMRDRQNKRYVFGETLNNECILWKHVFQWCVIKLIRLRCK